MATCTHKISTASTSNAGSYACGSFTPAVGDLLVVGVIASGTVAAGALTSSAGYTFAKIATAVKAASADTLYLFVANQLVSAAAAQTVTFDCSGDNATGAVVSVVAVAGMARTGANAVRQFGVQNNGAAAATPTVALAAAALTGNVMLGQMGNATSPATVTPPSGWTERNDTGYSTPTTGSEYATRDSGFTGSSVAWGSTSATAFGAIAAELDTSALPRHPVVMACM